MYPLYYHLNFLNNLMATDENLHFSTFFCWTLTSFNIPTFRSEINSNCSVLSSFMAIVGSQILFWTFMFLARTCFLFSFFIEKKKKGSPSIKLHSIDAIYYLFRSCTTGRSLPRCYPAKSVAAAVSSPRSPPRSCCLYPARTVPHRRVGWSDFWRNKKSDICCTKLL